MEKEYTNVRLIKTRSSKKRGEIIFIIFIKNKREQF